jgi:Protein of unknown function (DUF3307)
MPWVEVFALLLVSHLAGDFLLQTEWQALNKPGGVGRDPVARRALLSHIATYSLPLLPVLVWLGTEIGAAAVGVGALVVVPHLLQDDGRPVFWFIRHVKKVSGRPDDLLVLAVDQSAHVLALLGAALVASAA